MDAETIQEIEELAGYFFDEEQVALITGVEIDTPEFRKAFKRGSLKSEAEIRKSIIQLAKDGSSPAQTMAWKMVESQKRKEY